MGMVALSTAQIETDMADPHELMKLAARLRSHAGQTQIADYVTSMTRAAEDLEAIARRDMVEAEIRKVRRDAEMTGQDKAAKRA